MIEVSDWGKYSAEKFLRKYGDEDRVKFINQILLPEEKSSLHVRLRLDHDKKVATLEMGHYYHNSRHLPFFGKRLGSAPRILLSYLDALAALSFERTHLLKLSPQERAYIAEVRWKSKGYYGGAVVAKIRKTGSTHIELMLRNKLPPMPTKDECCGSEKPWGRGWHGDSLGHRKARLKASEVLFNSVEPVMDEHVQDTDGFL